MANIRTLKKNVNYITDEIIIECFTLDYLFPEKNKKELASIIAETLGLNQMAIVNINTARRENKKDLKNQINKIRIQTEGQIKQIIERLDEIK